MAGELPHPWKPAATISPRRVSELRPGDSLCLWLVPGDDPVVEVIVATSPYEHNNRTDLILGDQDGSNGILTLDMDRWVRIAS